MTRPRILFVTGKLAEPILRRVLGTPVIANKIEASVAVLPITVAALMQTKWVARKLQFTEIFDRVILPGWCLGDLESLTQQFGVAFERGPKDVFDLPTYLGHGTRPPPDLSKYQIEILAEINHAPLLTLDELLDCAHQARNSGADRIDLGCLPGDRWTNLAETIQALKQEGFRLSVDTLDRWEIETAVAAGVDLILSCNLSMVEWAQHLPTEFVVIPQDPSRLETLWEAAAILKAAGRSVRLDPILEPIGYGFAASLQRYYAVRAADPETPLLMGVGNLTELSEVDSAGVNFLLAALCEELQIHSVLTTQVVNWCRTSVKEFDLARRLVHHAVTHKTLPKHAGGDLVALRDARVSQRGEAELRQLSQQIRDPNYRIFAERGAIHVMNRDGYWQNSDPYELFDQMAADGQILTSEHAFYLGMEFQKARTALTLGKNYWQDEALRWGFLTESEVSALDRRKSHR